MELDLESKDSSEVVQIGATPTNPTGDATIESGLTKLLEKKWPRSVTLSGAMESRSGPKSIGDESPELEASKPAVIGKRPDAEGYKAIRSTAGRDQGVESMQAGDTASLDVQRFESLTSFCRQLHDQHQWLAQQGESNNIDISKIWSSLEALQNLCRDTAAMGMQHAQAVIGLGIRIEVLEKQVGHLMFESVPEETSMEGSPRQSELEPKALDVQSNNEDLQQYAETALKVSAQVSSIETRVGNLESCIAAEVRHALRDLGISGINKEKVPAAVTCQPESLPSVRFDTGEQQKQVRDTSSNHWQYDDSDPVTSPGLAVTNNNGRNFGSGTRFAGHSQLRQSATPSRPKRVDQSPSGSPALVTREGPLLTSNNSSRLLEDTRIVTMADLPGVKPVSRKSVSNVRTVSPQTTVRRVQSVPGKAKETTTGVSCSSAIYMPRQRTQVTGQPSPTPTTDGQGSLSGSLKSPVAPISGSGSGSVAAPSTVDTNQTRLSPRGTKFVDASNSSSHPSTTPTPTPSPLQTSPASHSRSSNRYLDQHRAAVDARTPASSATVLNASPLSARADLKSSGSARAPIVSHTLTSMPSARDRDTSTGKSPTRDWRQSVSVFRRTTS